jgi:hypothetical protein
VETIVGERLVMDIWTVWRGDDGFGGMTNSEKDSLFSDILDSGAFDFIVHLTNGYGDVFNMRSVWTLYGEGEWVDFKIDPASGTFEYDGYLYTWWLDWLDGNPGVELVDNGVSFSADPVDTPAIHYVGADGIFYHEVELIFHFAMHREPIVDDLNIGAVSCWAGWIFDEDEHPDMTYDLLKEIYYSGVFDFTAHLTNGYGDIKLHPDWLFAGNDYTSPHFPLGTIVDFKVDPKSGTFEYEGYLYTWELDWVDGDIQWLNEAEDGVYFEMDSLSISAEFIFYFKLDRESIIPIPPTAPNLTVTFWWKDTYGLSEDYVNEKIIEFYPGIGDYAFAVGTTIDDIRVIFDENTKEWYNVQDNFCYVFLAVLSIDGVETDLTGLADVPVFSLTIEPDVQHTIDFMLGVCIVTI